MTKKRILIVVGHPDKKSFCWNGIYKTATRQMRKHKQSYRVIDLYRDSFQRPRTDLIKKYQELVTWSTHIYFISLRNQENQGMQRLYVPNHVPSQGWLAR